MSSKDESLVTFQNSPQFAEVKVENMDLVYPDEPSRPGWMSTEDAVGQSEMSRNQKNIVASSEITKMLGNTLENALRKVHHERIEHEQGLSGIESKIKKENEYESTSTEFIEPAQNLVPTLQVWTKSPKLEYKDISESQEIGNMGESYSHLASNITSVLATSGVDSTSTYKYGNLLDSSTLNEHSDLKCKSEIPCISEPRKLNHHLKMHGNSKPYSCQICWKTFSHSTGLINHIKRHAVKHIKVHGRYKFYSCDFCGTRFNENTTLTKHIEEHTRRRLSLCNSCEERLYVNLPLVKHDGENPSLDRTRSVPVTNHIKLHARDKPFPCNFCGKIFYKNIALLGHMKTHEVKKTYKCKFCAKECVRDLEFRRHLKIHTGEKTYKCEICNENFMYRFHLKLHNKKYHKYRKRSKSD